MAQHLSVPADAGPVRRWFLRLSFLRPSFVLLAIGFLAVFGGGGPDAASSTAVGDAPVTGDGPGVVAAREVVTPTSDSSVTTTDPPVTTAATQAAPVTTAATRAAPVTTATPTTATAPTVPAVEAPTSTVPAPTVVPPTTAPAPLENPPGHFSGQMLRDGRPLPDVTVKVVNIHTPGWPRREVLDTLGGHDGVDVFVTTTDANGAWSVSGLPAGKQFMLKVFPPSRCDAYAEIAAGYTTIESGFIDVTGEPFMSTRLAPGARTYNVGSSGRFLFDMPVHVYPAAAGALDGGRGYRDLDVRFHTRVSVFATSLGESSGCTSAG